MTINVTKLKNTATVSANKIILVKVTFAKNCFCIESKKYGTYRYITSHKYFCFQKPLTNGVLLLTGEDYTNMWTFF